MVLMVCEPLRWDLLFSVVLCRAGWWWPSVTGTLLTVSYSIGQYQQTQCTWLPLPLSSGC